MATDSAIRALEALTQELRLITGPNAAPLVYEVRYAVERAIASLRAETSAKAPAGVAEVTALMQASQAPPHCPTCSCRPNSESETGGDAGANDSTRAVAPPAVTAVAAGDLISELRGLKDDWPAYLVQLEERAADEIERLDRLFTLRQARAFVDEHHRHHDAPQGGLWAIALMRRDELVGVAIAGRPVSRMLQQAGYCEIVRVCVLNGVRDGCSMLYGRCRRIGQAMGYQRFVSYTLPTESGASLRGAGFRLLACTDGGKWSRKKRPRKDQQAIGMKHAYPVDTHKY